jgi:hypothetical protein
MQNQLCYQEKENFFVYFWVGYSVLATALLMSPIFVFFRDVWIRKLTFVALKLI